MLRMNYFLRNLELGQQTCQEGAREVLFLDSSSHGSPAPSDVQRLRSSAAKV
jgi:hypothetical protein